ncbi:MAG: hypothetical protein AB1490_09390 [Pseudomonadota bacterium]
MKALLIAAGVAAALLVALWLWEPLVVYSLLIAIWAGILSFVAAVLNLVLPSEEKSVRIDAKVFLDGVEHRATGIATCRRRYEAYGVDGTKLARRLRITGGYVTLALPDRRQVQSSAFLVCSEDEFAKNTDRDRLAFYLIDRRAIPVRAQYTSVARSAANPAAPFRVEIASVKATEEQAAGGPAHLPDDIAGPRAIEDIATALTSYVAFAIPREVWSRNERLLGEYAAIKEFRAVPNPSNEVLARLVTETNGWPASGKLAADHTRVDLPAFGPPLPIEYVATTRSQRGTPVPEICADGRCVTLPVSPTERESVYSRHGAFFDPASQRLILVRAIFAGMVDPGKAIFMP